MKLLVEITKKSNSNFLHKWAYHSSSVDFSAKVHGLGHLLHTQKKALRHSNYKSKFCSTFTSTKSFITLKVQEIESWNFVCPNILKRCAWRPNFSHFGREMTKISTVPKQCNFPKTMKLTVTYFTLRINTWQCTFAIFSGLWWLFCIDQQFLYNSFDVIQQHHILISAVQSIVHLTLVHDWSIKI